MHLFLKKIYRKNPFPKIYRINQCEVLSTNTCETEKKIDYGIFTDSRDGKTYKWVRLKDGKKWMAQNLNHKTNDSWWYKDDKSNGDKYGRLYTWQAAKKACPSGWRLPTDNEWKKLANAYGGYYDWSTKKDIGNPKDSYKILIQGGSSEFSALLGGYRGSDGVFGLLGGDGYYWSSTVESASSAWYYNFDGDDKTLDRYGSNKSGGRSCRCLQD